MTVTAGEELELEREATDDQYFTADEPELPGAAADGPPPDDPALAPYGWTKDPKTHQWRPKKSPGRPRATAPPSPEEVAAAPPITATADQPPPPRDRKRKRPPPTDADTPMPKGGVIAKGIDRLYRRAGRMLRILDDELGLAVIECTRPDPDDPDAPTVGQAWEALARENPRIRARILALLKGGTWQDLIMAHAPIGIALFTRDWFRRLIPGATLERAAEVLLEEDEDTEPGDLRPEDVADMRDMAEAQAQKIAAKMGVKVPAGVAAAAMREAEARAARQEAPEAFQRNPRSRGGSRSKRRGR